MRPPSKSTSYRIRTEAVAVLNIQTLFPPHLGDFCRLDIFTRKGATHYNDNSDNCKYYEYYYFYSTAGAELAQAFEGKLRFLRFEKLSFFEGPPGPSRL